MDIKLKDFEGPLDLLLHLVSQYKVDIYDVPIVDVIEQYLIYIEGLKAMKLEIAGEYMVMASQLMLIKSRKLLPTVVESYDEEQEDPEWLLLSKIEEYRRYKLLSESLQEQHEKRALYYAKPKTELVSEVVTLKQDKSVLDIFMAFSKVMTLKQDTLNANHTAIARDNYRIEDMMERLETRLEQEERLELVSLFHECESKDEMITLFLAMLELVKRQVMTVSQDVIQGKIEMKKEGKNHESDSTD